MMSWRGPLHPGRGGAEVYTERVLRGLVERGHSVTWYSARYPSSKTSEYAGINLEYGWSGLLVYGSGHLMLRKTDSRWDLVVDQINTFGFCAPLTNHPTACLIHQRAADVWDAEVRWPGNEVGRRAERAILRAYRSTPFMTMCQSTIDEMHSLGWQGSGYVTPTGIDRTSRVAKSDKPVLCFLGRFDAKAKRLDHAVEIHQRVRQVIPECELWVIGRGRPPRGLLDKPGIKVHSDVDDTTRDELLGRAWCCLATSVREGWGRMVTEAGAMGTPTVGYDVPGLRDSILNGKTGFLVEPTVEAATEVLIKLMRRPFDLEALGDAARSKAAEVTWGHSIDAFEHALRDIAARLPQPTN